MSETTIEILKQEVSFLRAAYTELKELVTGQQSEECYTVKQVAKLLGLTTAGVNFHIRNGNIKTIGGKLRHKKIRKSELDRYIATLTKPEAKG